MGAFVCLSACARRCVGWGAALTRAPPTGWRGIGATRRWSGNGLGRGDQMAKKPGPTYSQSVEQGLLEDVKEHPQDDGPRSILADWLEEKGDTRGEFIRLQCQLARMPRD